MKIKTLKEIIKKKSSKEQFAVLTNLSNGKSEIFEFRKPLSKDFENYKKEIKNYYNLKKNGIIDETQIFIQNYVKPIEVIIVGGVHIAQYLIDFIKTSSQIFLTMSMAAIGLSTNLKDIRKMGYKPFVVGLIAAVTVGIISLIYIETLINFFI